MKVIIRPPGYTTEVKVSACSLTIQRRQRRQSIKLVKSDKRRRVSLSTIVHTRLSHIRHLQPYYNSYKCSLGVPIRRQRRTKAWKSVHKFRFRSRSTIMVFSLARKEKIKNASKTAYHLPTLHHLHQVMKAGKWLDPFQRQTHQWTWKPSSPETGSWPQWHRTIRCKKVAGATGLRTRANWRTILRLDHLRQLTVDKAVINNYQTLSQSISKLLSAKDSHRKRLERGHWPPCKTA